MRTGGYQVDGYEAEPKETRRLLDEQIDVHEHWPAAHRRYGINP